MKHVVILGAGFGGLRAATLIAKEIRTLGLRGTYKIILVDRNEHHTYTPLLYEAATTSKETADFVKLHDVTTYHIPSLISHLPIAFQQAEVTALDFVRGDVRCKNGEKLLFDHLVVALGSETNYFNIKGLQASALPLKTFRDAIRIRDTIWNLAIEQDEIRIVIGGGGSTGVELAGELKEWCGELEDDFPKCKLEVILVEAASSLLPGFSKKIINNVQKRLGQLRASITTGKKITSVFTQRLVLEGGQTIPYDVLVWAGGVKASHVLHTLPLQRGAQDKVIVTPTLECLPQPATLKLHSKIYGIGDNVSVRDSETKKPVPGVARAALSQAKIAAKNIVEDIKVENGLVKTPHYQTYRPREYPYIIPVGGKYAVAKIGPMVICGFSGWLLKGLVELHYLVSIMPFWRALKTWLTGLKIFIQNDRLG